MPVTIGPPPAVDVSGRVDTAEFRRRLGVGDGRARLDRELRAFVAGLGDERLPAFSPPLSVVRPPRPRRPDQVATRTQACLETGSVKGGRWAAELTARLRAELAVPDDSALLLAASGSAALRLAVQAIAGPTRPDDVAVLPSFTFAATGEMLAQLGYTLRFCDVRPDTWTMDPTRSRPRSPTATPRSSSRSTRSARRLTTRRWRRSARTPACRWSPTRPPRSAPGTRAARWPPRPPPMRTR